jgi:hypothetical protein
MVAPAAPIQGHSEVIFATEEDVEEARANALRRAGCTMEQLRQQAAAGVFTSAAAYRAWVFIRGLDS